MSHLDAFQDYRVCLNWHIIIIPEKFATHSLPSDMTIQAKSRYTDVLVGEH